MSYFYGTVSMSRLASVHPDMQAVMKDALDVAVLDISIIEGHRNKARQNRFYNMNPPKSKKKWPEGKHNTVPSDAVDAAPYINGKASYNKMHCCILAGIILACAARRGIKIRWGGNWDMDSEPITDQDFQDLVHYERVK